MSCESWDSNAQYDIVPMPQPGDHLNPIYCYLGEHMEKYLTHPYASPLFGDFKGLPPMLIQGGEVEVLRDEVTLLAHKATLAGVEVRHELYEDMVRRPLVRISRRSSSGPQVHVFQSFPFLEPAKHAFASCHDFVWNFLPQHQVRTPQYFDPSAEQGLEDEIDTSTTRVVRGDGTDTGQGPESLAEPLDDKKRGRSYRRKSHPDSPSRSPTPSLDEPSWGSMYLSSSSDDEGDFGDGAVRVQSIYAPPTTPVDGTRPSLSKATSFSRLRATFSAIADAASTSASSTLHLPPPHSQHTSQPASPARRRQRISSISMTSSAEAPPEPCIRRSQRSHPDISSLCRSWSRSGPANQTRTYKPDAQSVDQEDSLPRSYAHS